MRVSAVPNPVIGVVHDSIAVSGHVTASGRDRDRIALDVSFAEVAGDLELLDLEVEDLGQVELPRLRTVTFEVSPLVEAKRWTLVYLAPLQGTDAHFAVLTRVRE